MAAHEPSTEDEAVAAAATVASAAVAAAAAAYAKAAPGSSSPESSGGRVYIFPRDSSNEFLRNSLRQKQPVRQDEETERAQREEREDLARVLSTVARPAGTTRKRAREDDVAVGKDKMAKLNQQNIRGDAVGKAAKDTEATEGSLSSEESTDLARVEELMQVSFAAMRAISDGIIIASLRSVDYPVLFVNEAFAQMTGYTRQELRKSNCCCLAGPGTDATQLKRLRAALHEKVEASIELLYYKKDGSAFWVRLAVTPLKDSTGNFSHSVAVAVDITERKESENFAFLQERAIASLSEGICMSDPSLPDNPVVYANQAFLRMTGYSSEDVLGKNCRFLQGPETSRDAVEKLRTAIAKRTKITVELLNYRKNGEKFWNLLSLTPVMDPDTGAVVRFIGVQSDITELIRRKQQEKLLSDAKNDAESANHAKSMFLANMSHEIRTPLNGMIAVAQLLLKSSPNLSQEQEECLNTILESGDTLQSILGDILDFSKIDHGSMVLELEPLDIRDIVESCFEMVKVKAVQKGLEMAYSIPMTKYPELSCLIGDSIRVRQVFANIITNAVKFTEKGQVRVKVYVDDNAGEEGRGQKLGSSSEGQADSNQVRVTFECRDTGIGISNSSITKLFQSFRQGDDTHTRKYGGTGLGLAISQRLAELMGGSIRVESSLGAGSTFSVSLCFEKDSKKYGPVDGSPPGLVVDDESKTWELCVRDKTACICMEDGPTKQQVLELCEEWTLHVMKDEDNWFTHPTSTNVPIEDAHSVATRQGHEQPRGRNTDQTYMADFLIIDRFWTGNRKLEQAVVAGKFKYGTIIIGNKENDVSRSAHFRVEKRLYCVSKPVRRKRLLSKLYDLVCDADDSLPVSGSPSTEKPPLSLQAFLNHGKTAPRLDITNVNTINECHSNVKGKAPAGPNDRTDSQDKVRSKISPGSEGKETRPPSNSTKEGIGEVAIRAGQGSVSPPRVRGNNKGSNYFVSDRFKRKRHSSMSPSNHDCPSVVVAEDNKVNQLVVKKTLASIGIYDVRVAANGLEALAFLDERLCDLVLMDIHMPLMDGFEASREIHKRFTNPPKIVALSADTLMGDKVLDAGMEGFVPKPFRIEDISRIVEWWRQPRAMAVG